MVQYWKLSLPDEQCSITLAHSLAEYGYELGGSNRATPDASGEVEPYQPNWGNFGERAG